MNLDDPTLFNSLDPQNLLAEMDRLPALLEAGWQLGQSLPLDRHAQPRQIVLAGMGEDGIAAEMIHAYASRQSSVPITILRDYAIPSWVRGPDNLVIVCSHTGMDEEMLSVFEQATEAGCSRLAITTGGILATAPEYGGTLWQYPGSANPRAAIGYLFGLLLAFFARLNLIADPADELGAAITAMQAQQEHIKADVPTVGNPAKRQAGQFLGRWVFLIGAEHLAPVARRWKSQINLLAKAWAHADTLPEADHNTLAGLSHPEDLFRQGITLFLDGAYHPRTQLRSELTRKAFMLEGVATDFYRAQGDGLLAEIWTALHFGDYVAYYLAVAYGVDPAASDAIDSFQNEMNLS